MESVVSVFEYLVFGIIGLIALFIPFAIILLPLAGIITSADGERAGRPRWRGFANSTIPAMRDAPVPFRDGGTVPLYLRRAPRLVRVVASAAHIVALTTVPTGILSVILAFPPRPPNAAWCISLFPAAVLALVAASLLWRAGSAVLACKAPPHRRLMTWLVPPAALVVVGTFAYQLALFIGRDDGALDSTTGIILCGAAVHAALFGVGAPLVVLGVRAVTHRYGDALVSTPPTAP